MAQKGRKQCSKKGCRKLCVDGWNHCSEHKPYDPIEDALKLTVAEAEKWGRLDAEIRHALLFQKYRALEKALMDLQNKERIRALTVKHEAEIERLQKSYQEHQEAMNQDLAAKQAAATQEIVSSKEEIARLKTSYKELTYQLAEKYGVDVEKMVIDPDTGIIREEG